MCRSPAFYDYGNWRNYNTPNREAHARRGEMNTDNTRFICRAVRAHDSRLLYKFIVTSSAKNWAIAKCQGYLYFFCNIYNQILFYFCARTTLRRSPTEQIVKSVAGNEILN